MDIGSVLVFLAVAGTICALVCGVTSMAVDHEVAHLDGEKWMFSRVGLQLAAIALFVLVALVQRLP